MNCAVGQPDSGDGKRSSVAPRGTVPALTATAVLGFLILGGVFFPGCGKPPTVIVEKGADAAEKEAPWKVLERRLRKETDVAACRVALGSLSSALASDQKAPKLRGLTPEQEEALAKLVPLAKEDRDEIRGADFTSHDSVYVADCLYLRDAARSFDVPEVRGETAEQSVARRADAAFAWVCRQVYIQPWMVPPHDGTPHELIVVVDNQFRTASALPPVWVLRRGFGSGLERMYVFLALLQQMGLDGCLIGLPDAANQPAGFVAVKGSTVLTDRPRGPFWAVGVRVGNDVRLYDPWRSRSFPAPLSQLKANPDAQKAWFEDKANVSGITAALVKDAPVALAVPVNALAPRMAVMDEQLKASLGTRFSIDAAKLQAALPGSVFWNPIGREPTRPGEERVPPDQFSYGRTSRLFLTAETGADQSATSTGLFGLYLRSQLPPPNQLLPAELVSRQEIVEDVGPRILQLAQGSYGIAFIFPTPTPRERLQRGQFQDAASGLVDRQDAFGKGLERIRRNQDAEKQIRDWAETAVKLYAELGRALTNRDADGRDRAKAAIDAHWTRQAAVQLIVDRAVSGLGLAEATMLLALCKHEQAERLQTQLDAGVGDAAKLREEAAGAWSDAWDAWRSYTRHAAADALFPGRAEHIKELRARAEAMATKK